MNKLIAILMVTGIVGVVGSSHASAQPTPTAPSPALCAESDGLTPEEILLCSSVDDEGGDSIDIYPIPPTVAPSTTTTVAPTTTIGVIPPTVPPVLPATGSSGTSGFLQIGALLLTGGLLVVVAARRRTSPSTAGA